VSWIGDETYAADAVKSPDGMEIIAPETFRHPCGFVRLKERHRIPAERRPVNSQDRHCRIGRVKLK